jgi:hypothetical protein
MAASHKPRNAFNIQKSVILPLPASSFFAATKKALGLSAYASLPSTDVTNEAKIYGLAWALVEI